MVSERSRQGASVSVALLLSATLLTACNDSSSAYGGNGVTEDASVSPAASADGKDGAAAVRDWSEMITATPEGGYLIGNPKASVKLVEYASLTCPHCREFHLQGMERLKRDYISTGGVAYEFRNFVLNGADLAASMLARCDGTEQFFPRVDAFFKKQADWTEEFGRISDSEQRRVEAQPEAKRLIAYAEAGRLGDFARMLGISADRFPQCLGDSGQLDRLTSIRDQAVAKYEVTGTPSFVLNGMPLKDTYSWTEVKMKLDARLSE